MTRVVAPRPPPPLSSATTATRTTTATAAFLVFFLLSAPFRSAAASVFVPSVPLGPPSRRSAILCGRRRRLLRPSAPSSSSSVVVAERVVASSDASVALESSSSSSSSSTSTSRIVVAYDGAELASLEAFLRSERKGEGNEEEEGGSFVGLLLARNDDREEETVGCATFVVGRRESDGRRVVGMTEQRVASASSSYGDVVTTVDSDLVGSERLLPSSSFSSPPSSSDSGAVPLTDGTLLQGASIAIVPDSVSDDDALSTAGAALSTVHLACPRVRGVGGIGRRTTEDATTKEDDGGFVSGKTVVLGGGEYARFAAEGLSALGATVYLVTSRNVRLNDKRVNVMKPAVGESNAGFAEAIGTFDVLLDTLGDETSGGGGGTIGNGGGGGVVGELKRRHSCDRYVSTLSASQRIVRDDGVLFGPRKVESRADEISDALLSLHEGQEPPSSPRRYRPATASSPENFGGSTLQVLLDENVLFTDRRGAGGKGGVFVRGWALKDFWESASWPRDSNSPGVRYGFPVAEEEDEEDVDELEEGGEEEEEYSASSPRRRGGGATNVGGGGGVDPYVMDVVGVRGLRRQILSPKTDCVLFLSSPVCRACRKISSGYTAMAREEGGRTRIGDDDNDDDDDNEEGRSSVSFMKANTVGKIGRELGRALNVDVVPTFVLFRRGKRYGVPLSINRLPSRKLDLALEYLRRGMEWDRDAFRDADDDA